MKILNNDRRTIKQSYSLSKAKRTICTASVGAFVFGVDSFLNQKEYIKKGEDFLQEVFNEKKCKYSNKCKIEKVRQSYLNIINTQKINKKMLSNAALHGSIFFAGLYILCNKIAEHTYKKT